MRTLYIINRIIFLLSFFLPFFLLPHCSGKEETVEKEKQRVLDSIHVCDSVNRVVQASTADTALFIKQSGSTKDTLNKTASLDTTINKKTFADRLHDFHMFLQLPSEDSISGYGIAMICFNRNLSGIVSYFLLFSFLFSIAGIFMLFIRRNHILQTVISLLSLLFLLIFLCFAFSDDTTLYALLWGFWTCLFFSMTNVIISIRMRKKHHAAD